MVAGVVDKKLPAAVFKLKRACHALQQRDQRLTRTMMLSRWVTFINDRIHHAQKHMSAYVHCHATDIRQFRFFITITKRHARKFSTKQALHSCLFSQDHQSNGMPESTPAKPISRSRQSRQLSLPSHCPQTPAQSAIADPAVNFAVIATQRRCRVAASGVAPAVRRICCMSTSENCTSF